MTASAPFLLEGVRGEAGGLGWSRSDVSYRNIETSFCESLGRLTEEGGEKHKAGFLGSRLA